MIVASISQTRQSSKARLGETLRRSLNSICPYFTMYPLDFPLSLLRRHAKPYHWVFDPFCGRGTTNFAARLCGLASVGFDSSPIAVAIAKAKLARARPSTVLCKAEDILRKFREPSEMPTGEFWSWAYHPQTLHEVCRMREALLSDCSDPASILLRAIILGALHGPRSKNGSSYLSNQCPRTFAPKPRYSARFWREHRLDPPKISLLEVVRLRAKRYLSEQPERVRGVILQADSRRSLLKDCRERFHWVITSPPYYGMRTYIQDQWLRNWFLGGPSTVSYARKPKELSHGGPEIFALQLSDVWRNAAVMSAPTARLVCRFGGINDRKNDPISLIKESFRDSGWRILTVKNAGTSLQGRRQALQFGSRTKKPPRQEYDVYAYRAD
jgi:DNA methylase